MTIQLTFLISTWPGGLNSWEQSRLRCVDMLRCTFSNCGDFLDSRDVGFWNVKIKSLDWDLKKIRISRHFTVFKTVETWVLKCQYFLDMLRCHFWSVKIFSTVEIFSRVKMSVFQESRCTFLKCRDWESRSRACQDKSRPPGLISTFSLISTFYFV